MKNIKQEYEKDDATLIASTMALLPKEYGPFKSGIKVDKDKFSNFTIYQFRAELKEFYEDNIKPMKKQAEENFALEKKDKYCTFCNKKGHDISECWFKNGNNKSIFPITGGSVTSLVSNVILPHKCLIYA